MSSHWSCVHVDFGKGGWSANGLGSNVQCVYGQLHWMWYLLFCVKLKQFHVCIFQSLLWAVKYLSVCVDYGQQQ